MKGCNASHKYIFRMIDWTPTHKVMVEIHSWEAGSLFCIIMQAEVRRRGEPGVLGTSELVADITRILRSGEALSTNTEADCQRIGLSLFDELVAQYSQPKEADPLSLESLDKLENFEDEEDLPFASKFVPTEEDETDYERAARIVNETNEIPVDSDFEF